MSRLIAVTLTSQTNAETVKSAMVDIVSHYYYISVADYLELVGLDPSRLDETMGWTHPEVVNTKIKQVGENEFLLDLPEPKPVR